MSDPVSNTNPSEPFLDFQTMASQFAFSGADPASLTASSTKFTLATLVIDVSGSVSSFQTTIEALVGEIVRACQKDPSADSLMLRVVIFNNDVDEVHGFRLLGSCNPNDYKGKFNCGGLTNLYGAMTNAIEAAVAYGNTLAQSAFMANAVTFVITDGQNNIHQCSAADVAAANKEAVKGEHLESSQVILMGLTDDQSFGTYLKTVETDCKCDKSMVIGSLSVGGPSVNAGKIAKLVGFISHSVSSTAQACGTGGPSKAIPSSLTI